MAHESDDHVNRKIARGLELLVRLQVEQMRGNRNQTDMIRYLAGLGVTSTEIVSFLGVPATTVHPIVSRSKSSTKGRKPSQTVKRKKR